MDFDKIYTYAKRYEESSQLYPRVEEADDKFSIMLQDLGISDEELEERISRFLGSGDEYSEEYLEEVKDKLYNNWRISFNLGDRDDLRWDPHTGVRESLFPECNKGKKSIMDLLGDIFK